ncbi:protein CHUP1, chloroplastic-like [Musa troglodytarum]|uniref:Protein CHUP1, chloroplastic-like n=1 Tax=Musa troglodytarum TaxID=320322 RepID=A0A9E7GS37_9LILI|nr:protein CHUP1, chloroplastic-like [Musa troglodytarum]
MESMVRGRGVNPIVIKLGVPIGLTFAGFIVAQLSSRARPRVPSPAASGHRYSSGALSQATGRSSVGLKELRLLKGKAALATIVTGTSTTTVLHLAPTKTSAGDEECDHTVKNLVAKDDSPPKKPAIEQDSATEQEIESLRRLVCSLQENERSLELQLLEYYGMQEQAAAVRDLERQLQMSSTEAKLYSLRIESLQSDIQRLEAQLADLPRVMNELESARSTIRLLKKKSRSDAEQAAERTASLRQRISQLQRQNNEETEGKLKRLAELEDEAAQLKLVNSSLTEQNSDLTRKLESAQTSASSAREAEEADASEKANFLKVANEKLVKDIEQLKTEKSADVEELVYLRWVNACLRYELKNYKRKAAAKDLNKSSSPESEEKPKLLMLEYADSGIDEKTSSFVDFDSEHSFSSQTSTEESEDTASELISSTRHGSSTKMKFIGKLKKLVLGKQTHSNRSFA